MRSTGEVMGIDATFGLAFAKSQAAAGDELPAGGTVFFSLADRDKPGGVAVARRFVQLGFPSRPPPGRPPRSKPTGCRSPTVVAKVTERGRRGRRRRGRGGAHPGRARCDLVVNTPRGRGPRADGAYIRRAANQHRVACLTTVAAARAAAAGIADRAASRMEVRSLQEFHADAAAPLPLVMTAAAIAGRRACGGVELANPILTASGTSGHGAELAAYMDLAGLGAVVVKSVSAEPWEGNPAPRLHPSTRAC